MKVQRDFITNVTVFNLKCFTCTKRALHMKIKFNDRENKLYWGVTFTFLSLGLSFLYFIISQRSQSASKQYLQI